MKIKILFFAFLIFANWSIAQEATPTKAISKAKLAEIERSIQANTKDTELLALIEKEKELTKKLNNRVAELTKSDETYNVLQKELATLKATKTDKLIAHSEEYKENYDNLETTNTEERSAKQAEIAKKQSMKEQELAEKKAKIAKKQSMKEQELAEKKAEIAKKQSMIEQEQADKKAALAKKQSMKAEEYAQKQARVKGEQENKAKELAVKQKQKQSELAVKQEELKKKKMEEALAKSAKKQAERKKARKGN